MAFEHCAHRSSQDVVLLHVVTEWHLIVLEPLLRADKLVAQVEKLLEALACKNIVRVSICVIDTQYRVASPDVLDQQWEHCVDFILNGPNNVKLQVDKCNICYGTLVDHGFDDCVFFNFESGKSAQIIE